MKKKVKPNWADPNTTAENEVLPGWLKWVWSGPGIAFSLNFLLMAQITYYCTDLLGLGAATVGMILLVSKAFDAVTDLIAGYIIDRTNTRWGKARPFDIFMVLTWVCVVLLFSTPDFGTTGKIIYVFCLYTLANSVCCTLGNCGGSIYMKRAIRSEKNWTSITAFQGALLMIFCLVAGIAMPTLIATLGAEKSGWTVIALIFAVPLAILSSLRMFFVKEVAAESQPEIAEQSEEKVSLKDTVKALFKNKLIFILGVMIIVYQATSVANPNTYYFKWIFGDIAIGSLLGLAGFITPILLIFVPAITRKLGTTKFLVAGMIVNLIGCLIRMFFAKNILMLMLASALTLAGTLPVSSLLTLYVLDCMEYGKKKSGVCIDGVTGAFSTFATKIGSSLGSAMLGMMMGASGYISDPAATTQPDSAINMIYFLFAILPVILAILTCILAFLYKREKTKVLGV